MALSLLILLQSAHPSLAETKQISVWSGGTCDCYEFERVDAAGKPWRVTLKVTEQPKHGTLRITTSNEKRVINGVTKTVPVTKQSYKAKFGYFGPDNFRFVLVVGDPTDNRNGQEYSVAVTVK